MKKSNILKTLRMQIALHYLKASGLILLLMCVILYYSIASVVLSEATSSTKTAVEKSGMYIDLYIDRLKAVSGLLAENAQLVTYFSSAERDPTIKHSLLSMIETTMATDRFIQSVVIVSKDGQVLSNEKGLIMSMSSNMMKEQWYVAAVNNGSKPVLTSARMQHFSMDKDNWVISISREIKNAEGQNIGVLLIDIQYKVIEDFLANLDLGKDGFSFIINDNGEVVYHKDTAYFENYLKQQQLQQIIANQAGYDKEKNTLTHTYKLNNADWTFVGVSSQDGLLMIKRQLLEIFLLVGMILFIIAAVSVALFAGRITVPFQRLEKAMQNIEHGLKEIPIDEKGCFEAQSLAKYFNRMIGQIEKLMQEITEKEKHLRATEISALHSQINPHFLYNTLDTIVWMAEFNDSEKVIEITKALAQFFRLSLSGGNEMTTVENELDHVRQYLFIQKERYGDKLNYKIVCNQSIRNVRMPKILLQPIVENALYHGIRSVPRNGHIHISAIASGDDVELIVRDNGQGFDIKQLNRESTEKRTKLGGVGIKNVDQRIKLYYGPNYGITINSSLTIGTTVTIKIPQEMN
ncbi:sensor histidine kinase [Lysinibacillus sp. NPDC093197]|uniref:cache domain-containing sensor histidine kinase n=1 Tax=Lysinibacillus sp. NPDC093197 TaxID=3364132 RepID=UPI0037F6BFBA